MNVLITEKEVEKNIGKLKAKKSPRFDRLTNEMLKCTNSQGIKMLTMLPDTNIQIFPTSWNYGQIKLINKEWIIYDPNNYNP